jgi:hypothetical protein
MLAESEPGAAAISSAVGRSMEIAMSIRSARAPLSLAR